MPWGIHKGKSLEDVPAQYLIWLYNEGKLNNSKDLKDYIEDNMAALKLEIQNTPAWRKVES